MRKIAGSKGKVLLSASFPKLENIFNEVMKKGCRKLMFFIRHFIYYLLGMLSLNKSILLLF